MSGVWLSWVTSWGCSVPCFPLTQMRGSCPGCFLLFRARKHYEFPESLTEAVVLNWSDSGHGGHWQGLEPFGAVTAGWRTGMLLTPRSAQDTPTKE